MDILTYAVFFVDTLHYKDAGRLFSVSECRLPYCSLDYYIFTIIICIMLHVMYKQCTHKA